MTTQHNFTFLSDPGHGWLVVPANLVAPIEDCITQFSWKNIRSGYAYLEEDCDAPVFLAYLKSKGIEPVVTEKYQEAEVRRGDYRYSGKYETGRTRFFSKETADA